MALIHCPECGKEVSDQSDICIHCGYPLVDNYSLEITETSNSIKLYKNKKLIVLSCIIGILLITYFTFFHLGKDNKYAYDLVINNVYDFKNPKSVRVVSGSAGFNDTYNEEYAFLCVTATNSYGAETTGYYCFHPDEFSDVTDYAHMVNICKKDEINAFKINFRITLYWIFR